VQLEALPQDVEDVQLDQTLLRKPFGETGQGGLAGHGDVLLGWIGGGTEGRPARTGPTVPHSS
jgi:hypothetical protein